MREFAAQLCASAPVASRLGTSCRHSTSRKTSMQHSKWVSTTSSWTAGAAPPEQSPILFRDNISVPTIPALARARRHLDRSERDDVTLIITGGSAHAGRFRQGTGAWARTPLRLSNAALAGHRLHRHACLPHQQLPGRHRHAEAPSRRPAWRWTSRRGSWPTSSKPRCELMQVMARACGHDHLSQFTRERPDDLEARDGRFVWRCLRRHGVNGMPSNVVNRCKPMACQGACE